MEAVSAITHAYRPGEEVIVRLAGAEVHNIERDSRVDAACLPPWTIGVVVGWVAVDGEAAYVMRFEHDGCACVCVAPEAAVEGVV